jgi:toxin ParE1/3/4
VKLLVTSTAQFDLEEIEDYIARDRPDAASRWIMRTLDEFNRLTRNPVLGESRNDIRPEMRSISHGSYVIYFRPNENVLEIIRVLHGARDIRGLF